MFDLATYFLGVFIAGWGSRRIEEEMDIVVGFLLKNFVSYSKFVSAQTEGGGRPAKCG